jgi:hypothetical protein
MCGHVVDRGHLLGALSAGWGGSMVCWKMCIRLLLLDVELTIL